MVVTDPNLPDNPIIYVNDAFVELTGYSREASVGRNCRFLQGPHTDRASVKELRESIAAGDPVALEIVNQRSDGSEFINSLAISPIRSRAFAGEAEGEVEFFLGIQSANLGRDAFRSAPTDGSGSRSGEESDLPRRLQALQSRVESQVGFVLATVREVAGAPGDAREAYAQSASRLESLAQLYEGVFRQGPESEDTVRLGAYLSRVCSATHLAHPGHNIRLLTDFAETECGMERAARIGVVLSELLGSALEAAAGAPRASIRASLRREGGEAVLRVDAANKGRARSILPEENSVGMRLLAAFLPELGTDIAVERSDAGTRVGVPLPGLAFPGGAPRLSSL